ncbi:MAG: hypothetical protein JF616_19195 [Fibrobacteres bacterium]|nr:hypothetical protein [Fibrobacterota bacterium]
MIAGSRPNQIFSVTATVAGQKPLDAKSVAASANGVLSFGFPAAQAGEVTLVNTGKVGIAGPPKAGAWARVRSQRGAVRVELSLDRPARVGLALFGANGVKLESLPERTLGSGDHVLLLPSETGVTREPAARVRYLRVTLRGDGWRRSVT